VSQPAPAVAPDSSVVIAGFATWHEKHERARQALRGVVDLVAHAELEAYSVLTRLPEPFQIASSEMAAYLGARYPGSRLSLPDSERRGLVARLAQRRIFGGAVYDALVAATAAHHGCRLLSCDRRAAKTYEGLGIDVTYL
jgi:predicted nucleic acid-binding protein